ncbi:hypothetical protein BD780_002696 [Clostridium tetanomorphum]|uniref:Glycoside hydrolase n=1 Tax=Clostridium tetanomorphum TaxID=1553 RepID=A0A923EDB7_CLOTT|nr:SH3 domain-containing protein [Clostridium tetanomorphum]KAJ50614.1 NLP/P60 protein [Clostridium tetanomorphum DSM 665]MBC2399074.1 glycoside hydrolase [Clostridium tetanomorphum]MBP1862689.1 hypothetical protein [Clostridium tetanomorphum]NRS85471.1 hypothetical protein [Clostridium tetanomorphum]NRZ98585.1 hypothetical protein [Clostridium tetanomorphum]
MKKIKIRSILSIIFSFMMTTTVFAGINDFSSNMPKVKEEMMGADFWINNTLDVNKTIMDKREIEQLNMKIEKEIDEVVDLEKYKTSFTKDELTKKILNLSKPSKYPRYDKNGKLITDAYYSNLKENLNLNGLQPVNNVKYGITVRRTLMKTYPTYDMLFKEGDNYEFDRLMETAVYPIEPLVILSESKDKQWYFAQMYNYLAWIPAKDVALTTKENLFSYVNNKSFLVTTGKRVFTVYNPLAPEISEVKFDMGVRIPLASKYEIKDELYGQSTVGNYVIKIPVRGKSGNMALKLAMISRSEDVNEGYLIYRKRSILNQCFKFLGERYGWGGMFNGRDCSAFVMDVYRTIGIKLPRNTSEQENNNVGKVYEMNRYMHIQEREDILDDLNPGGVLYMPGHTMIYLGKYNGEYYMIHDFSGYYNKQDDGKYKYYKAGQVMVTPVKLGLNEDGTTYLDEITTAKEFINL